MVGLVALVALMAGAGLVTWQLAAMNRATEVDILFDTCVATAPSFDGIGKLLASHGFDKKDASDPTRQLWLREADASSAYIAETDVRRTCMIGRIGQHTDTFTQEVERTLFARYGKRWERKNYQGRQLYLVPLATENVLIEIIPPSGATTFVAVYVNLEK